jgi:hypothetical protein
MFYKVLLRIWPGQTPARRFSNWPSWPSSEQYHLHIHHQKAVLSLAADASSSHVGSVLQQAEGKARKPLAFFSKKLSLTEQGYSTFHRELLATFLAIFVAIRHFWFLIEGRSFHIITDPKPLTSALHRVSPPISA